MIEKLQICLPESQILTKLLFQKLLGSIIYLMVCSRPDICYAVSYSSCFQCKSSDEVFYYLLRVLQYLYYTHELSLKFSSLDNSALTGYVDADFGNDVNDRKLVSGQIFWCSKERKTVALSSTKAEFVAVCGSCELLHLLYVLEDMSITIHKPVVIYEYNQSAIKLLYNG